MGHESSVNAELPRWAQAWLNNSNQLGERYTVSTLEGARYEIGLKKPAKEPWQLSAECSFGSAGGYRHTFWQLRDPSHTVTHFAFSRPWNKVFWFKEKSSGSEFGDWMRQPLPHWGDRKQIIDPVSIPGLPSGFWYGGIQAAYQSAVVGMMIDGEIRIYHIPDEGEAVEVRRYPPSSRIKDFSQNEKLVAISHIEGSSPLKPYIDVLDLATGEVVIRLPASRAVFQRSAQFSPDSTRLVFSEERDGWQGLSILNLSDKQIYQLPISIGKPADLEGMWLPTVDKDNFTYTKEFDKSAIKYMNYTLEQLEAALSKEEMASWLYPPEPDSLLVLARHGMSSSIYRYEIESGKLHEYKSDNMEELGSFTLHHLPYGEGEISQPSIDFNSGKINLLVSNSREEALEFVLNAYDSKSALSIGAFSAEIKIPRVEGGQPEIPIRIHIPGQFSIAGGQKSTKPLPTVFLLHGGPHLQDWDTYNDTIALLKKFGYVVVTVNYRGSTGYGADWVEALLKNPGFSELEDVAAARRWVISQGISDPKRCAIMGGSHGGYLALLGATTQEGWRAAVAQAPRVDLMREYYSMTATLREVFTERYSGSPADKPEVYRRGSPLTHVKKLSCPVHITIGKADPRTNGPVDEFCRLAESYGKKVVLKVLSGGHLINDSRSWIEVMVEVLDHLETHMPPSTIDSLPKKRLPSLARHIRLSQQRPSLRRR